MMPKKELMLISSFEVIILCTRFLVSTETDLGQNSLASQQFCTKADYEAHHCKPSVPLLSKGGEAKFGVVHGV
jgi:hypothetical protein